jgi:hypothetical protein
MKIMKKTKLNFLLFALLLAGISFTSCDDNNGNIFNEDEETEIRVESVEWKSDLKNGYEVALGDNSLNVANRMNILPKNATNQIQAFSSSNTEVATITSQGQVTPISYGTTIITVTVDEKTDQFELQVVEQKVIAVSSISITVKDIEIRVNSTEDLSTKFAVIPGIATNKAVSYESMDPTIVSVDAVGIITGLQAGTATVIVKSVDNPSATGEFNITVKEAPAFIGDYPRDNWEMTASHTLFVEGTNSLESPFDEDTSTWFALVRPGKTYGGVSVPSGDGIYFIVDMKVAQDVDYFRIRHRNTTQLFIRYHKIQEISGSNDGMAFTSIATNVAIPNVDLADNIESPNIEIPLSKYRYIKFYCKDSDCFYTGSGNQGSSAQLSELYLGVDY